VFHCPQAQAEQMATLQQGHQRAAAMLMRPGTAAAAASTSYGDKKNANRDIRVWHGATEIVHHSIANFCGQIQKKKP
jgi:hypothetical protein